MKIKYRVYLLVLSAICLFIYYYFDFDCLFQTLFHIPCPGCGMSHAVWAALHLDYKAAFKAHFMFWSLPYLFCVVFIPKGIFANKKVNKAALTVIGIGFLLHYVLKLWVLV